MNLQTKESNSTVRVVVISVAGSGGEGVQTESMNWVFDDSTIGERCLFVQFEVIVVIVV